jgi:hypothetical protein
MTENQRKEIYKFVKNYGDEFGVNFTCREYNINSRTMWMIRTNQFVKSETLMRIYEKITGRYFIVS